MDSIQERLMQQFQSMDKAYEDYARSKGLNYLSLMVLEEIYELGDGCTQKQIADDTHYPKQCVVELKELPENRKNKGITLTEKGRQLCDNIVVPLLQQEEMATREMKRDERLELIRLLELYGEAYCNRLKSIV